MSQKVGPDRVFRFKFSLGTLKLTHLLYRKKTFISGQLCRKIQKIRKFHFSLNFSPSCGSYTKKWLKKVVGNWKLHSTNQPHAHTLREPCPRSQGIIFLCSFKAHFAFSWTSRPFLCISASNQACIIDRHLLPINLMPKSWKFDNW